MPREILLMLDEAEQMLPADAVKEMLRTVPISGWSPEVLLPTGAKAYARTKFVPNYGMDIEFKVSGYAADGSDVTPYDPVDTEVCENCGKRHHQDEIQALFIPDEPGSPPSLEGYLCQECVDAAMEEQEQQLRSLKW